MSDQAEAPGSEDHEYIEVQGWPRARVVRAHDGRPVVVLDDAYRLEDGSMAWIVICPWCREQIFAIGKKELNGSLRGKRAMASCGCRKGFDSDNDGCRGYLEKKKLGLV